MKVHNTRSTRKQLTSAAMLPVRKWLTTAEAAAYLSVGINEVGRLQLEHGLTLSVLGKKHYYLVSELDALLAKHIAFKKTA